MSKKSFTQGLDSLLESTTETEKIESPLQVEELEPLSKKRERGQPRTNIKEIKSTAQIGTLEGETRATFIVKEEQLEKIKAVAYWDRLQIKDVLKEAMEVYFEQKGQKFIKQALSAYENKNNRN